MSFLTLEEREHGVCVLTLHRPEAMNALCRPLLEELAETVKNISQSTARIVVITGAGKAFCVGADLKERRSFTEEDVREFILLIRDTFTAIEQLPQPVIAAVNGYALGGGMELALACDLRLANQEAVFGLLETSLGIIPGAGGTQRLPRIVGMAKAKELIFLAKRITGEEALKIGLINECVTDSVLERACELASQIAQNAPLAVQQAKCVIHQGLGCAAEEGLLLETQAYEKIIPTEDRLEGLRAFAEKRRPQFAGR